MLSENKILYVHRHPFKLCWKGFKIIFCVCCVSNHGFTVIHLSLNVIQTLYNLMQLKITIFCLLHMWTILRLKTFFFLLKNFHFSCTKEQLDCEIKKKKKLISHCKWCNFSMAFSFLDDEFFLPLNIDACAVQKKTLSECSQAFSFPYSIWRPVCERTS